MIRAFEVCSWYQVDHSDDKSHFTLNVIGEVPTYLPKKCSHQKTHQKLAPRQFMRKML